MMRTPTRTDIYAAELKLYQSQRATRASLVRAQVTAKKGLQQITRLAIIAGVVGISLIWLVARRPKAPVVASSGTYMVGKTSMLGLIAFLLRYGKVGLPLIMHQIRKAQTRSIPPRRALLPNYSDVNYISHKSRH